MQVAMLCKIDKYTLIILRIVFLLHVCYHKYVG